MKQLNKRKSCCQDDAVVYYPCPYCKRHAFHLKRTLEYPEILEAEDCCENPKDAEPIECYQCGEWIYHINLNYLVELEKIKS